MIQTSTLVSRRLVAILAIAFASHALAGAPLADHVPGDAVAYIGWAGADSQQAAYRASDLSAFIDHSNLPDLAKHYVPKVWDQLAGQSGDKRIVDTLKKMLPLLWRHPVAIYVSNVSSGPDGTPDGIGVMICDAGNDANELENDLRMLVNGDPDLRVTMNGTFVFVSVVLPNPHDVPDVTTESSLSTNAAFVATMQKLQESPTLAIYVDGKTLLSKLDESAAKDTHGAADIWPKVRDALGIGGLKTYAMSAGFDGTSWMTASILEAPSPRTGLLAAIEPKAIDPALLARIPASAGSVSVFNLDLAKLIDTIGDAMGSSKESDQMFHQANGIATMVLGRPFRSQIIAPLGPQWVLYSDAKLHSAVLINHPSDAATAGDSMVSALFGLVNVANAQIPGASTQPVVNAVQTTVKQVDVTSAVTKFASPSFAVKDGVLYLGLTPESVVNSAISPAVPPAADLMHSADFTAAVKRLGAPQIGSFDYCDLPNTAPAAYDSFGKAGAQIRQVMSMFSIDVPKIELPPIDQLKTHLSPAISVSWADDQGVYAKSISPFPLSTQLLGDPQQSVVSATTISMASAILMPAFSRARSAARATQLMSNERQMLLGLMMYANNHRGLLPPDLGSLITDGDIAPTGLKLFLLPDSKKQIPAEISGGTKEQIAAWVNDNSDFKFLLAGKKMSELGNASRVAAIVPNDAETATANVPVGFADGHVEACRPDRVQQILHPDRGDN